MRYLALACDYDGTLASAGRVSEAALTALQHFRASGRKVILVTGRQLEELISVFPELDLCEWVVAENGALLYQPSSHAETRLADPPSAQFIRELKARTDLRRPGDRGHLASPRDNGAGDDSGSRARVAGHF
jgi:HAD superfamily hydrolase (TIGR01484 family)